MKHSQNWGVYCFQIDCQAFTSSYPDSKWLSALESGLLGNPNIQNGTHIFTMTSFVKKYVSGKKDT